MPSSPRLFLLLVLLLASVPLRDARPADHDDTNGLKAIPRHDARLTDLHVFTVGDKLAIAVSTNPMIPKTASSYTFPSDLSLRINVDGSSKVRFDDATASAAFGGTVQKPDKIEADQAIVVTFDGAHFRTEGIGQPHAASCRFFAGLRDDPFIRGPRRERNVGAVVAACPLKAFTRKSSTLLVWATTSVPTPSGPTGDHGGRALRSQFAQNLALNDLSPAEQSTVLGAHPDVVIFDTTRPAEFPNGRALTDDVVDLAAAPAVCGADDSCAAAQDVLNTDAPFPSTNDRPFLAEFPYLADPHPPCGGGGQACCSVGAACGAGLACTAGVCL